MKQWFLKSLTPLGLIGASLPLLSAQTGRTAVPGTINYLEGQVSIDGYALNTTQMGNANLGTNQTLSTGSGMAEVLLSPGVFLRVGNNSQVRMISPELVDPRVEVTQGEAMIEVDLKLKDSRIDVVERGADASILKEGLYRFDTAGSRIEVIDGKLQVTENGQPKDRGKGREVTLTGAPLKTVGFDRKAAEQADDLYRFSSVRSAYLAEANQATANYIYTGYGPFFGQQLLLQIRTSQRGRGVPGDGFFYSRSATLSSPRPMSVTPASTGAVSDTEEEASRVEATQAEVLHWVPGPASPAEDSTVAAAGGKRIPSRFCR